MSEAGSTVERLAEAARVVWHVAHQGRALDDILQQLPPAAAAAKAAVQALSFGTLRWYPRLALWIEMLVERPPSAIEPQIHALLAVGLHQLNFSRHPQHAMGHSAVEAARLLGRGRAAGFVNAVLRNFLRQRDSLQERVMREPVGRHAHPEWFIKQAQEDWPDDCDGILAANNEAPPMWLRVNRLQGTVDEYLRLLSDEGIQASAPLAQIPEAVLLQQPLNVGLLPGFASGRVSVQDAAAQLAAQLLAACPGMRVLDACAAPGGKTTHVLERNPDLEQLVIVDRSLSRLRQVEENLSRLALQKETQSAHRIRMIAADAASPQSWWSQEPHQPLFHRILLDAPCSSTGVIRRHPDIKLLRRSSDIAPLAQQQLRLLKGLWPLLQPGGRLLYVSCSILHAENAGVIGTFLSQETSAYEESLAELATVCKRPPAGLGWQILPGSAGMDGFYYACLGKR